MKKRDFLAGMCCGAFIARASVLDLSMVFQIILVAIVVLALNFLWEWTKNAVTKNTSRNIALRRLPKYS
jgi:membrane protein implicated in regulation of membrane protease activity